MKRSELQGSEKQIKWAEEIRERIFSQIETLDKTQMIKYICSGIEKDWEDTLAALASITDASWWIRFKDEDIRHLLLRVYESLD